MLVTLRWMLPSMTPSERAMVLGDMRRNAPPGIFDTELSVMRPHLSNGQWGKLARALELAR